MGIPVLRGTPADVDPRWWAINVPEFECPDERMEAVYDYRWSLLTKHLRYATTEIGYVATEFNTMQDTWSGRFGAISCPAEMQLNELRWLRDARYVTDTLRYWLREPDNCSHLYSWSLGKACEEVCSVLGDWTLAERNVDRLIEHQMGWDEGRVCYPNDRGWDEERGMYWNTGRDSSGEFNLASCQLDEKLRGIEGYKIRGGAGYRPDINANMYGNLSAIAHILSRTGQEKSAEHFRARADALNSRVLSELWDARRKFFFHRWRYDEYAEGDIRDEKSIRAYSFSWDTNRLRNGGTGFQQGQNGADHGRELSSYWMWNYGMVPPEYDECWRLLRDPAVFEAPYGPCTGEQGDPWFSVVYGECRMNGDSWPLHTSRTLTALRRVLQMRDVTALTRSDFAELMDTYTRTQWKDDVPYCAESHDPYQAKWTVDREEGMHYFHSSYCDLVIGGLMGLVPREDEALEIRPLFSKEWAYCAVERVRYHGHDVSIYWDAKGTRYGLGKGLHVVVDGTLMSSSPEPDAILTQLPSTVGARAESFAPEGLVDLAVNNRFTAYPMLTTSCEGSGKVHYMQNGRIWFHGEPINGWVNENSARETEWVQIDFGKKACVRELRCCFYEDALNDIALPREIWFEVFENGEWRDVAPRQQGFARCQVHCLPIEERLCTKMRIFLRAQPGCKIGLIEWEIWGLLSPGR